MELIYLDFGKTSFPDYASGRFQKKIDDLKKYSSDIKGLNALLDEINNLKDLNFLRKLNYAFDLKNNIYEDSVVREDFFNSQLLLMARKYLEKPTFLNLQPFKGVVFQKFLKSYRFFEYFYYMGTEKPLNYADMENLYYGGLGERVIVHLDKFDELETTPQLSDEFFQRLKKVKWEKQSKKLFNKINFVLYELEINIHVLSIFSTEETLFITFLCFCSAAADNRELVSEEDVVKAFKTYIKLMKTNLTIYTAKKELIGPPGYLVCDKCSNYYQLKLGESPDDFGDTCECGGKLEYYETPDYPRNFSESPLYRFLKMDNPELFLRLWGLVFVIMGIFAIYGYFTQINFPLILPIGIFLTISGILPFITIHKAINIYYTLILLSMGIFSFIIGAYLPGITFTILSIIVLQNAWKIKSWN